jgi:LysM repeat protein
LAFSLLFGGFFAPLRAKAQAEDTALTANVSPASFLDNKKLKNADDGSVKQDASVNILSDNALVPTATGHISTPEGTDIGSSSSDQVSVYVVRKGDSFSQIADMFGVSVNTILWANNLKKGDKLTEGQILVVLPISGIEHTVIKGETIKSIAKLYKVDVSDITSYNGIAEDSKLAIGDTLIVPGADISTEGGNTSTPKSSNTSIPRYYSSHPLPALAGYFINPVPGAQRSQGYHDNNAVDLAISKGTPIHASASGTVIFASMGWNGAFGGLTIIDHQNGAQTLYAHQSKIIIHAGDTVSQGDIIGYVGSTGHSTGPHLHFEVHGAKNPGVDGTWASNTLASN